MLHIVMMSGGALQTPHAGEPSIPVLTFTCVPSLTNSMLPHVLCLATCQAMSAILPQDHEILVTLVARCVTQISPLCIMLNPNSMSVIHSNVVGNLY